MLKRSLLFALLLSAGFLVFFACRKGSEQNVKQSQVQNQSLSVISVKEAKSWYANMLSSKANAKGSEVLALATSSDTYAGIPDFNRSFSVDLGNGMGILKVPIEEYAVSGYGFRDVLFQKEADNSTRSFVMEVRLDPNYLRAKIQQKGVQDQSLRFYVDNNDFTGLILIYNSSNRFVRGRQMVNGQVKYEMVPSGGASTLTAVSSTMRTGGIEIDGDNSSGYIITGVEIIAPAPEPPPMPWWIFPPISTGINPPTQPFPVGGNGAGGSSSPSTEYNKNPTTVTAGPGGGLKCSSFNFVEIVKVDPEGFGGGWQECAVTNLRFTVVLIDLNTMEVKNRIPVKIDSPMYFGMRIRGWSDEHISPGKAAELSAQAVNDASDRVIREYKNNLTVLPGQLQAKFIEYIKSNMVSAGGGRADFTGSNTTIFRPVNAAEYKIPFISDLFGSGCN
ncbi:hypothetical protein EGT74_04970 [Chitinophaga lutea]|uniref:Uncharacterized protein n=1 Tax=Chitinophaga lutea TaxID=2488634 RepID=A0A3N4Q138_9BACT|nr:hypothetical protein [Chitinophaga lutea]RPE12899.1 hypothetical protein EGT74_04970 [Chitinophaga lutea]